MTRTMRTLLTKIKYEYTERALQFPCGEKRRIISPHFRYDLVAAVTRSFDTNSRNHG